MSGDLALGTAQWGMPYGIANKLGAPRPEAVTRMLTRARSRGVSVLDTARAYGESEALIGRLARDPHWKVITKVVPDVDAPGLSRQQAIRRLERSLEASRRALRRSALDAVLLHRGGHRHAHGGALWSRLLEMRQDGWIGVLGVSAANPAEALELVSDPEIEILQVAASLLDPRLARAGFFDRARDTGIAVHVRSVFLQGVGHMRPEALPRALAPLAEPLAAIWRFAARRGVPARALFLAHARALGAGVRGGQTVVGCETPAQLTELLEDWTRDPLEPGDLAGLAQQLPRLPDRFLDPSQWPPPAERVAFPPVP